MAIVLFARGRSLLRLYPNCYQSSSAVSFIVAANNIKCIPSYIQRCQSAASVKNTVLAVYNGRVDLRCFKSSKCGEEVTMKSRLKKAVAEYGTTVMVFHITISLISLGLCYSLISNGIDLEKFVEKLGFAETKMTSNAGVFLTAYAIHKLFAPVRIAITLGATPVIVRYLRHKGILKKPLKITKKK
ncbi:PREDICTED: protein FAM210B-like [Nicrophorus vespilloides]|uniref:Protein FAM210B-like n=1 Tax=Nicrophorus vespilloides TaxID=110193 RepID=A0ABM1M5M1_NICVS|nr:PREDICTED: protein FAM210B-like [Nicrophorus vespilloides]